MDEEANARLDIKVPEGGIKLCIDCKYHEFEDNSEMRKSLEYPSIAVDIHWCKHPSHQSICRVTGKLLNEKEECGFKRKFSSDCGADGRLWEPKE